MTITPEGRENLDKLAAGLKEAADAIRGLPERLAATANILRKLPPPHDGRGGPV